jgi:hypothetical protein
LLPVVIKEDELERCLLAHSLQRDVVRADGEAPELRRPPDERVLTKNWIDAMCSA